MSSKSLKVSFAVVSATVLTSFNASAHSDYWRCAVAAGSAQAVESSCGTREAYDNRVSQQAAEDESRRRNEENRREEERQREDYRRREEENRREADRREEENRRIQRQNEDDEASRRSSYGRATRAERQGSARVNRGAKIPARRSQTNSSARVPQSSGQVITQDDLVLPIQVNAKGAVLNIGAAANLGQYKGLRIKAVKVETSTPGQSRVNVLVSGVRIGSIVSELPGEYEKVFQSGRAVIKGGAHALVLTTQGDVVIQRVTIAVGR